LSLVKMVEYEEASPEVRAVYDDIMTSRRVRWITNFWKTLAHDPAMLKRTWESLKAVMAPGALDELTKELIYIAVSATNNCEYCVTSHSASARKAGMTDAMLGELLAVVAMANATNRLANGYLLEVDEKLKGPARGEFGKPAAAAAGKPVEAKPKPAKARKRR
jgi:AhpD family alkylhydroperoxidase